MSNSQRRQPVAASALPADPCPKLLISWPAPRTQFIIHPTFIQRSPERHYRSDFTRNTLPQPHSSIAAQDTRETLTMPRTKSPSRSSTASSSGSSAKTATKRLIKEMDTWRKEQREEKGIERLGPVSDENLLEWEAVINGRGVGAGYDGIFPLCWNFCRKDKGANFVK